jgi:glycosyltransferase involved in cell wall biosynthesis
MRILFVSSWTPEKAPAYETRIVNIERYCRKLGANTSRLLLWKLFFNSPVFIQPLNIPFILRYLRSFDVIIAEGNGAAYVLGLARFLLRHHPLLIYDMHNDALAESFLFDKGRFKLEGYLRGLNARLMEYVGFNSFNYFAVASQGLKQKLLERALDLNRCIKDDNVEVILNGVDMEAFRPQNQATNNVGLHPFTVAYSGSYAKYQGIENVVKAAEILHDKDIHFKFMGFRKEDSRIRNDIKSKIKEKVTCFDWLPKDELISELLKADILLSPSAAGTGRAIFPTKFAEYLALAKPVIVASVDETSSIVKKCDCGFICDPTAESISQTILKAKETPEQTLLLKGLNGRRYAEKELDLELICQKYLVFLNTLMKEKNLILTRVRSLWSS